MLIIRNQGEIELAAFTLMGATTKREDASKIGFFGSGNKYAIATLLRKGIDFVIYSGTTEYEVRTQDVAFRGSVYKQIMINGQPTSLTTDMGPDWEVWFTIREFICNAIDEGGYELELGDMIPQEGTTFIGIEETPEVLEFYNNREKYILESAPILELSTCFGRVGIYEAQDTMNVYRKGVSIMPTNPHKSLYWYNFSNIEINESRVYKYEFQVKERIAAFFAACTTPELIWQFINCKNVFENDLYWSSSINFSSAWFRELESKTLAPESYRNAVTPEDHWCYVWMPDNIVTLLHKQFPSLMVLGQKNENSWLRAADQFNANVAKALESLGVLGHVPSVPVYIGCFKSDSSVASYNKEPAEIRLSVEYLEDAAEVEVTLLEEIFHSKGYGDGSRRFELLLMTELLKAQKEAYRHRTLVDRIKSDIAGVNLE